MTNRRRVGQLTVLAVAFLIGGGVIGAVFPRLRVPGVTGGFVGYVLCGQRALAHLGVDERVFEHPRTSVRESKAASAVRAGLLRGTLGSVALGHMARPFREPRGSSPNNVPRALRFRSSAKASASSAEKTWRPL